MAFLYYQRSEKQKFQKINCFSPEKCFCITEKILQVFIRHQTLRLHYTCIRIFLTLKIEKTRNLNFVSFSGLENSETILRNET